MFMNYHIFHPPCNFIIFAVFFGKVLFVMSVASTIICKLNKLKVVVKVNFLYNAMIFNWLRSEIFWR